MILISFNPNKKNTVVGRFIELVKNLKPHDHIMIREGTIEEGGGGCLPSPLP
jgi:hypothetical protein